MTEYPITDELRKQVAQQHRAIAHMARAILQVHEDMARLFEDGAGPWDEMLNHIGERTARRMETLGDMLNGMDAVDEEDEWTDPVFAEAHRLWPVCVSEQAP